MELETITENQRVKSAKKIKKMFGHIDYRNPPEVCPIRHIMSLATDKWSILILLNLGFFPTLRFNRLKRYIYGISAKVLSERLKNLEIDGYLTRTMYPEVPIRVEYKLTDFGHSFLMRLLDMAEWSEKYSEKILEHRKKHGKDV